MQGLQHNIPPSSTLIFGKVAKGMPMKPPVKLKNSEKRSREHWFRRKFSVGM